MSKYIPETSELEDVVMTGAELMDATTTVVRAMSTDFATDVQFAGDGAFTDGKMVSLPAIPSDAEVTKRDALVIGGYGNHEALHKKLTDFEKLQKKMKRWHKEGKTLTKSLANGIEDVRIENGGKKLFGGIPQAIDKTAREVTRKFIDEVYPQDNDIVNDFGQIGPVAITWAGRKALGYADPSNEEALDLLPPKIRKQVEGIVQTILKIPHGVTGLGQVDKLVAHEGSMEAAKLAEKLANSHMRKLRKEQEDENERITNPQDTTEDGDDKGTVKVKGKGRPDGGDGEGDGGDDPDGETGGGDSPSEDDGTGDDGDGDGDGVGGDNRKAKGDTSGEAGEDGEGDTTSREDGQRDTGPKSDEVAEAHQGQAAVGAVNRVIDPKSIGQPSPYEPGLQEAMERVVDGLKQQNGGNGYIVLAPSADKFHTRRELSSWPITKRHGVNRYSEVKGRISGTVGTVRRKLERILTAMAKSSWENKKRSGKLDVRRNVAKIVDLKTNIFRRKVDEIDLNTALSCLIDFSGSMDGEGKISMAQQITIAIAEALAPVGVPFEVLGHKTSWGSMHKGHPYAPNSTTKYGREDSIIMYQIKAFEDSLAACRGTLGMIDSWAGGANADGDAIMWAAERLLLQQEDKKVLFVLSDGQPAYDSSSRCIHQYTRDAVEWCTFRGIDIVGLGMLDDSVKQYYPQYVTVADMDQFGKTYIDTLIKVMLKKSQPDQSILIKTTAKRGKAI